MKESEYSQYAKRLGELNKNSQVLSASMISNTNQVFYGDDLSSALSSTMDLSVRYVTQEQFHGMVNGDPKYAGYFESKTLYVISSDEINAYNTNIKNVADPIEAKDAANRRYVDETAENAETLAGQMSVYALTQAKSYANGISGALSTQIGNLDVANTLAAGQILTSLSQSDGKISYGAKTLEVSNVNGLNKHN